MNPQKYQLHIAQIRTATEPVLAAPGMAKKFHEKFGFVPKAIYHKTRRNQN